jgi:hypothetical protein
VLAAALGIKFEPYAITFMTAVYKGLVITVQVSVPACLQMKLGGWPTHVCMCVGVADGGRCQGVTHPHGNCAAG